MLLLATLLTQSVAAAQTVQYRSPAGVEYRSLPDTGEIARALANQPKLLIQYNEEKIIKFNKPFTKSILFIYLNS